MKSNSNSQVYSGELLEEGCMGPGISLGPRPAPSNPHRTGKAENVPHPELLRSPAFLQIPLGELPGNVGVPSLGSTVLNNSLTSGDSLAGCSLIAGSLRNLAAATPI